jgi:hypothetical protein
MLHYITFYRLMATVCGFPSYRHLSPKSLQAGHALVHSVWTNMLAVSPRRLTARIQPCLTIAGKLQRVCAGNLTICRGSSYFPSCKQNSIAVMQCNLIDWTDARLTDRHIH